MTLTNTSTTATHKTYFISDLHLNENQPHIADIFFRFLKHCDTTVDGIYILGDLFEAWIGDDDRTPFHLEVMGAIEKTVLRGIPVYFIAGNRDFLIGRRFASESRVVLLPEEQIIQLYGQRVLLMHGDTLCIADVSYQRARRFLRNRLLQQFFLWLPLSVRRKIANKMREKSMRYTSATITDKMDAVQSEIESVMQLHQVDLLIHGHTHRPAVHGFTLQQSTVQRIVLGAWHQNGSAFVVDAAGNKQLIDLL